MKTDSEYARDLTEIRSMMERSSRFLSLSGLSGILAGFYALAGSFIAYRYHFFVNENIAFNTLRAQSLSAASIELFLLAGVILVLAIATAALLSRHKARKNNERIWTSATRRLLVSMAIPLAAGGIFILILLFKGLLGFVAPLSLTFYGLALVNASNFTYNELRYLGVIQIILGLIASYYVGFALFFWAIGFGVMHIIYGIVMHVRYER